ncbi:MAG: hypothetical protein IPL08_17880 [Saprospiraceae bacterium]|nr:hypothetical protein [Saprospiraceae bacterium]
MNNNYILYNYSGSTLTNNGTLNNNYILYNQSDGTMTNNGTLKGTGILTQSGTFTNNSTGIIAPGVSPGTFIVTGSMNLGNGTYQCEINGTSQGTTFDWLDISGTATLTNANLVVDWGSYTPIAGDVFNILTAGSRVGTFNAVTIPAVTGLQFAVNYYSTYIEIEVSIALPIHLLSFEAMGLDKAISLSGPLFQSKIQRGTL